MTPITRSVVCAASPRITLARWSCRPRAMVGGVRVCVHSSGRRMAPGCPGASWNRAAGRPSSRPRLPPRAGPRRRAGSQARSVGSIDRVRPAGGRARPARQDVRRACPRERVRLGGVPVEVAPLGRDDPGLAYGEDLMTGPVARQGGDHVGRRQVRAHAVHPSVQPEVTGHRPLPFARPATPRPAGHREARAHRRRRERDAAADHGHRGSLRVKPSAGQAASHLIGAHADAGRMMHASAHSVGPVRLLGRWAVGRA